MTSPFVGTFVKSFRRCWVEVIAPSTDWRLTRDLMLDAVPYSSPSIFAAAEIWDFGGRINEIILVPFLYGRWQATRRIRKSWQTSTAPANALEREVRMEGMGW